MSLAQKYRGRVPAGIAVWAALAATLAATAAWATPGTVNLTTYLRAGPGPQFAALDEVAPESQLDVQSCANGWCRVVAGEATGYIQQSVLSAPDIHRQPAAAGSTDCVTARLNGPPRSADEVRVCRK